MSEIEDTFNRINQHKGVLGILIVNSDGAPIKTTIEDANISNQYAQLITALTGKVCAAVASFLPFCSK